MTAPIAIWFSIIIQRVPVVDQHPASDDPAKTLSEIQCTIASSSVSRMVAMSNVDLPSRRWRWFPAGDGPGAFSALALSVIPGNRRCT
jgi:hypothetical protein